MHNRCKTYHIKCYYKVFHALLSNSKWILQKEQKNNKVRAIQRTPGKIDYFFKDFKSTVYSFLSDLSFEC